MLKLKSKKIIVKLFAMFFLAGISLGQEKTIVDAKPIEGPLKENISLNARLFESIEVDIFNKLNDSGVTVFIPEPKANNSTHDYKIALNLGIAVAGAISSVVNEDKTTFLKYARIVHDYGERLGVEETILSKYNTITKTASQGEWQKLEELIYDLKDEITTELYNEDMKGDAILAMVSGWLEGLHIVAKSLEKNVSNDANKLLGNRDFVRYLTESMKSLDDDLKNKKEVKAVFAALPKLDEVINQPKSYSFKKGDIKRVLEITEPLRNVMTVNKAD